MGRSWRAFPWLPPTSFSGCLRLGVPGRVFERQWFFLATCRVSTSRSTSRARGSRGGDGSGGPHLSWALTRAATARAGRCSNVVLSEPDPLPPQERSYNLKLIPVPLELEHHGRLVAEVLEDASDLALFGRFALLEELGAGDGLVPEARESRPNVQVAAIRLPRKIGVAAAAPRFVLRERSASRPRRRRDSLSARRTRIGGGPQTMIFVPSPGGGRCCATIAGVT